MSLPDSLAITPPMGWNSYTCYGITVREDEVIANARYMAAQLAPCGWQYVVVDGMWYEDTGPLAGETPWESEPFPLDDVGRLLPNLRRFPAAAGGRGFKPLADEIHRLGLKFGIHIMRGIPRLAVERNLPILGTPHRAAEIADRENICPWYAGMYGINMSHPGGQAYYDALLALYAAWEVDYLKADDSGGLPYQRAEIDGIARAIARCGRPIVLSLSIGDELSTFQAEHRKARAELWRIGPDLHDEWPQLRATFDFLPRWMPHVGPGCWADPDMLPLGMLHLRKWAANQTDPHLTHLTRDEQITLMTLWCISRAPLLFAGNLPDNDDWTLSLLTNMDALAVNQRSTNNRELFRDHHLRAWIADDPDSPARYLACFHLGDDAPLEMRIPLSELALPRCQVRDLWAREEVGVVEVALEIHLQPHAAVFYRLTP